MNIDHIRAGRASQYSEDQSPTKIHPQQWGHDCTQNCGCPKYRGKSLSVELKGNGLFDADAVDKAPRLQKIVPNISELNGNQLAALISFSFY